MRNYLIKQNWKNLLTQLEFTRKILVQYYYHVKPKNVGFPWHPETERSAVTGPNTESGHFTLRVSSAATQVPGCHSHN